MHNSFQGFISLIGRRLKRQWKHRNLNKIQ
jgi:hypothetical protein